MNEALPVRKGCCSLNSGRTWSARSVTPPRRTPNCSRLRGRGQRGDPEPAGPAGTDESRSVAAVWGDDGRLTAWIPTRRTRHQGALVAALGLDPENVRVITRRRAGSALVRCRRGGGHLLDRRELGRPGPLVGDPHGKLVGMPHGRAQQQKITIGGMKDGTSSPTGSRSSRTAGPTRGRRVPAVADDPDDPGPYRIPRAESGLPRSSPTPPRSARTGGQGARGRRRDRSRDRPVRRPGRGRPGRGPPEEPAAEVHRAAHDRVRRRVRLGRLRHRAREGPRRRRLPGARAEQARRRRGETLQLGIGLSSTWRSPARRRGLRAERERHRRGAPGRHRHGADRHLAARPGPPDGVGDAGQRGARHPDREDHRQVGRHRPGPRGRRHRRLAVAPTRRRGGAAGVARAARRGQGAGGGNPRGVPGRPGSTTSRPARSASRGTPMSRSR